MDSNKQLRVEKYIRLLVIIFFVFGFFGSLYGALVLTAFHTDILDATQFQKMVEQFDLKEFRAILNIVFYFPLVIAAIGLHKKQRWGRNISIVWSALNLPLFPLGTIIALYSFWVLFKKDTKQLFNVPESSLL